MRKRGWVLDRLFLHVRGSPRPHDAMLRCKIGAFPSIFARFQALLLKRSSTARLRPVYQTRTFFIPDGGFTRSLRECCRGRRGRIYLLPAAEGRAGARCRRERWKRAVPKFFTAFRIESLECDAYIALLQDTRYGEPGVGARP